MCDYQCDEKLGKVRAETRKAKAEIERITREHGAYLGQIETLHFMEKITGDIAPVGSYCSCDAMKRLLDAAGYRPTLIISRRQSAKAKQQPSYSEN